MTFNAGERNLFSFVFVLNLFLLTLNLMGGKILMQFKAGLFEAGTGDQKTYPMQATTFS